MMAAVMRDLAIRALVMRALETWALAIAAM
jgi:hypothetical protein